MAITFGSKKSKVKKFDSSPAVSESTVSEMPVLSEAVPDVPKTVTEAKSYKTLKEIFADMEKDLKDSHNVDAVSVYQLFFKDNSKFSYKRIYGAQIDSQSELEKYYGFDCPVILTNVDGFYNAPSHRARLIERYGIYTIIISSPAFEGFKLTNELEAIRSRIKSAYKEVKKL